MILAPILKIAGKGRDKVTITSIKMKTNFI